MQSILFLKLPGEKYLLYHNDVLCMIGWTFQMCHEVKSKSISGSEIDEA